jgi:hypothetical protein
LVKTVNNSSVCSSAKCIDYAKSLKVSLSPMYITIDPCEDFSTFACEGWRQTHDYTPGNSCKLLHLFYNDARIWLMGNEMFSN